MAAEISYPFKPDAPAGRQRRFPAGDRFFSNIRINLLWGYFVIGVSVFICFTLNGYRPLEDGVAVSA